MFGNFKDLAQLPQMLAKAREMQAKMGDIQDRLKDRLGGVTADGEAAGGSVRATVNGRLELVSLRIDPARLNAADASGLESDVIHATALAHKLAAARAQEVTQQVMGDAAADAGIPPGLLGGM